MDKHYSPWNPPHDKGCPSSTVGFRFHPTDEELIGYYLKHKMNGNDSLVNSIIGEIDLCQCEPSDIPEHSLISSNDQVWYVFNRPDYKYSSSKRANRTTRTGFWKPTGKIRNIKVRETGKEIGSKRTLVFYQKVRDSKPVKTNWVIHEYQSKDILPNQSQFVLCKLKHKADEIVDHSPEDADETSRPMDAQIETEQVLQSHSHICNTGIQQGVSAEHLIETNCSDNQHMGLDFHDTIDDDDAIKLADSFLSLDDECFTEKKVDVPPKDYSPPKPLISAADTASDHNVYFQSMKISNLNDGDASSKEYQQMQILIPTETPTFGEGNSNPYQKGLSVITGTVTAGSAAARASEINYARHADKPIAPVLPSLSRVTRDKSFQCMKMLMSGEGPQLLQVTSKFAGQELKSSKVSTREGTNLSCMYTKSKEPEKPDLNLKSSDNDREGDADSSPSAATLTRCTSIKGLR